jgi:hypothetical protein
MAYKTATKSSIKESYITTLKNLYPFYVEGSRPLDLAHKAADQALAGKMKLEGEAWFQTLLLHGIDRRATMRFLSELPD